jgi:uncharacterized protein YdcH (DUF465 family)
MTTFWVANTTKQTWRFTYRLNSQQQPLMHELKAGNQISLTHLSDKEIEDVIKQNRVYGAREAKEVSRRKGFAGIVYKIGADPINMDELLETFESNDKVREAEAAERLKKSALAMSDNIANTVHRNTGAEKESVRPARVEVETIEVTDGGKPAISQGVEVVRKGVQPQRGRMS